MTSRHARVRFSDATGPDLHVNDQSAFPPWAELTPYPCTWLRQCHGNEVVVVDRPGAFAGAIGDAAVTSIPGAALGVITADCAPIALLGARAIGVVHAGWRGLEAGVIGAAAAAMRELDQGPISARLGPCIQRECYEFGTGELNRLQARFGETVVGRTSQGAPALDLPAAVRQALGEYGVILDVEPGDQRCTACDPGLWSYRARRDSSRQGLAVWIEPEGADS